MIKRKQKTENRKQKIKNKKTKRNIKEKKCRKIGAPPK
jgi:hypothetical protein